MDVSGRGNVSVVNFLRAAAKAAALSSKLSESDCGSNVPIPIEVKF